jgi:glutathione S-transferase
MVESIAIMEYLMARHGPTPLAPAATDTSYPTYQQFLRNSPTCTVIARGFAARQHLI